MSISASHTVAIPLGSLLLSAKRVLYFLRYLHCLHFLVVFCIISCFIWYFLLEFGLKIATFVQWFNYFAVLVINMNMVRFFLNSR